MEIPKKDGWNVDEENIKHLEKVSLEWWDPRGIQILLHSMNPLRVEFIRDGLINTGMIKAEDRDKPDVFKGISILDVGCGAGVLTEALAKLDANVTGLEPSEELIRVARDHIKGQPINVEYISEYVEEHSIKNADKYDAIVASEVVEHVPDQKAFLQELTKCLKPNGSIFITTPNRTIFSLIMVKFIAEYILNIIQRASHDWWHFIRPSEVETILEEKNCKTVSVRGIWYTPFFNYFNFIRYAGIHYFLQAVKQDNKKEK
ncbi:ubiquinone biosynthesis O-methyltransferase, mitochondrial-like [Chironomus tepperi]|uniref:ubiquinone biosynthesis O-methyltransferase, mitochondrial-like n=1 Tax=Chironomus tepperi TaxID=113505 RepID=UPI00391F7CA7